MAKSTVADRLQQRLQEIRGGKPKASLVPAEPKPKPEPKEKKGKKEKEEPAPALTALGLPSKTLRSVRELAQAYQEAAAEEKAATARKNEIADQLKAVCKQFDIAKAQDDTFRLSYFNVPRKTIKAEKLLEFGVSPKIITDSTQVTDSWQLRISSVGEQEE